MKIAIIGCGPAGLSCALRLADQDHQISMFERMSNLTMQGSGIVIQPVGLAALDILGIRQEVEQYGQKIFSIIGRSVDRNRLSVYVDYSLLSGTKYALGLQRGALFKLLYNKVRSKGVNITTNIEIDSLRYHSDNRVHVIDKHNQCHGRFDFVIDASGASSKLHRFATKYTISKALQYGSMWTKVDLDPDIHFDRHQMELYCDRNNIGIGLMPIGRLTLGEKPQMALFWNMKWIDYSQWRAGNLQTWKNLSIEKWPSTEPFLQKITHHDQLYPAKFIHHTLPKPIGKNIAFVGDAAHTTNPQLGQGVNMSLVDAVVLSCALQQYSDLNSALNLYSKARKNHVTFYQTMARVLTPFYQSDNKIAIRCRDLLYQPLNKIPLIRSLTAEIVSGQIRQPLRLKCRTEPESILD